MSTNQIALDFTSKTQTINHEPELWLGIKLSHRELFNFYQDEWFSPPEGKTCYILGVCSYSVGSRVLSESGNQIYTYVSFNLKIFPNVDLSVLRNGKWVKSRLFDIKESDEAVRWQDLIPTSFISSISVEFNEEQNRLISLSHQVSNVTLPEVKVASYHNVTTLSVESSNSSTSIQLPDNLDRQRGALAMAMYTVPRIGPWLDLLTASINVDKDKISKFSKLVNATWWNTLPWKTTSKANTKDDLNIALWKSAIFTLSNFNKKEGNEIDIVDEIISLIPGKKHKDQLLKWREETEMILKAKKIVDFSDWKEKPIQKAIQLFLLRPEPSKILTWFEDIPSLPPSVWWSAASLCGLFHGYRRLDSKYRGEKAQRELFTLYSLSFREITRKVLWPGTPESNLNWSRKEGSIFFNWGKVHLEAKKEHARGSWYFSNFENEDVLKKAKDIAIANNWDCLYNEISVSNKTIKVTGPGKINTKRNSLDLIVKGEIKLALPLNVKISEILDIELFKSFIALERVTKIAPPPPSFLSQKQFEEIPGLKYFPNFISENEEKNLISIIDNSIWRKDLHRRVQHYGWRYDYKAKTINESMYLGPLPSWAHDLATKLYKMKIVPFVADQVIVNEYVENQGISKHVDCVPCFEDNITTISLKESWEMVFRDSTNTTHKISKVLERRSATTISGPSRYRWTHEIPKRLKEPNGEKRGRRISITFRKVNQSNKIL